MMVRTTFLFVFFFFSNFFLASKVDRVWSYQCAPLEYLKPVILQISPDRHLATATDKTISLSGRNWGHLSEITIQIQGDDQVIHECELLTQSYLENLDGTQEVKCQVPDNLSGGYNTIYIHRDGNPQSSDGTLYFVDLNQCETNPVCGENAQCENIV